MGSSDPRSITLRPGTPVLLREPGFLQVGLSHPASGSPGVVRLPDTPDLRRQLDLLRHPTLAAADSPEPDLGALIARLDDAGLLVDCPPPSAANLVGLTRAQAQFGRDAERRLRSRAAGEVAVEIDPLLEPSLAPVVAQMLGDAGLACVAPRPLGPQIHLVVAGGVLDRERVDELVQGAVPHLIVSGSGTGLRVGPFVDPGRTACLRCVDAHESLHDPRRTLLLAQAARQDGERPLPRDPTLDALVVAWAVRDLTRFIEGDRPSTWSATVDVGPTLGPILTEWGRHPDCGCAWDAWLEFA